VRATESFEAGELFAAVVRGVAPVARERNLSLLFDGRGPAAEVACGLRAMRSAMHRLVHAAVHLLDRGCVDFSAETAAHGRGKCVLSVRAAGLGMLARPERIADVLRRLELQADAPADARLQRARGVCPTTGTPVEFSSHPCRGIMLGAAWTLSVTRPAGEDAPPDAAQAPAWIVHDDALAAQALARRLERLGWAVTVFDSPVAAVRRWRAQPPGDRPAAVLALECSAVSPTSVQPLAALLTDATHGVYAVLPGSPVLRLPALVHGLALRLHPFSAEDLRDLTAQATARRMPLR